MSQTDLYMKIVQVMSEVGQLQKDGSVKDMNGKKMYDYLSEENTTAALQAAFVRHNLVMFPITVEDELIYIETIKRGELIKAPITRVKVTYRIVDAVTGSHQDLQSIGYGSDSQDKGSNKAMTGAFKYVQRQTFMISTGEDGDHTASDVLDEQYKRSAPSPKQPEPTEQPKQTTDWKEKNEQSKKEAQEVGQQKLSEALQRDVMSLMNKRGMKFPDLNELCTAVLERPVKFFKKDVVDVTELKKIKEALDDAVGA